jgi:hypothetical protein
VVWVATHDQYACMAARTAVASPLLAGTRSVSRPSLTSRPPICFTRFKPWDTGAPFTNGTTATQFDPAGLRYHGPTWPMLLATLVTASVGL